MRISLAFVLVGLVACGGSTPAPEAPTGGGTGGGAKPSSRGDVSFVVPPYQVKGLLFEPEALGSPGMPLVEAKKKTTLEKQRQVYEKTKDPVLKEAQADILATMLYLESKNAKGDEQKKLQADARQVLRDAAANSGDKVDEITLRLLGSYELMFEDYPAAEKAWGGLVTRAPKDKDVLTNKAWWAYSLLMQHKNAEALAVVKDETLSEKTPELAYVAAWAKWRTGDDAGAWNAILTAAKGWNGMALRDVLDRELLFFAGRTNTGVADAVKALSPYYKGKEQQYALLAKLGLQSYLFAARWADGVSALDQALNAAEKVPPNELPVIRYSQADFTIRLDDPVTAGKFATQAVEALPACGPKCSPKDMDQIVYGVYLIARLFHNLYATAHDDRYYQPAHDLYQLTVPKLTDDKTRKDAQKNADLLEQTFKSLKAGVGTHDRDNIGRLLSYHQQDAQACYEHALESNPKLAGNVVVNLESDQTGVIKGVSTEPKAGLADMSAVAGCIAERAKTWKLPTRAQAGSTRIKLTYALSPAKQ